MSNEQKAIDFIRECTVEGMTVIFPGIQLDRPVYQLVAKKLQGIGGKWDRKIQGFKFERDPQPYMDEILSGGKVNVKKDLQFFETPEDVAVKLCRKALLRYYNNERSSGVLNRDVVVLEPSFGRGMLMEKMANKLNENDFYHFIDGYGFEIDPVMYKDTKSRFPGWTLYNKDVLDAGSEFKSFFDIIVANPPFAKGQAVKHFMKYYSMLSAGGVLACIMEPGWLFREQKRDKEFREFLGLDDDDCRRMSTQEIDKYYADWYDPEGYKGEVDIVSLAEGSFKSSGTNIRTVMVFITKGREKDSDR